MTEQNQQQDTSLPTLLATPSPRCPARGARQHPRRVGAHPGARGAAAPAAEAPAAARGARHRPLRLDGRQAAAGSAPLRRARDGRTPAGDRRRIPGHLRRLGRDARARGSGRRPLALVAACVRTIAAAARPTCTAAGAAAPRRRAPLAETVSRVILLSDGCANAGFTDVRGIGAPVPRARRGRRHHLDLRARQQFQRGADGRHGRGRRRQPLITARPPTTSWRRSAKSSTC